MPLSPPNPITWKAAQFPQAADFNANIRDALNFTTAKTVFRAAQNTAGQSIPNSAITVLTLDTVLEDTYSGWTTGAANHYTAQVDGLYLITVGYASTGGNGAGALCTAFPTVTVGSNTIDYEGQQTPIPSVANWTTIGSCLAYLRGGSDTVKPTAFQSSGAALATISVAPANVSYMEIEWLAA